MVLMWPVCSSLVVITRSSQVTDEAILGLFGKKNTPFLVVGGAGKLSLISNLVMEIGLLEDTMRPLLT